MTYSYTTSVNLGASKNKPGHTREHVTVTFLSIVSYSWNHEHINFLGKYCSCCLTGQQVGNGIYNVLVPNPRKLKVN